MFEVKGLRQWQIEALDVFKESSNIAPLFNVCPGGGKTRFAGRLASGLKTEGTAKGRRSFFVIVVPTRHLKSQWRTSLLNCERLEISTKLGRDSAKPESSHGMAITYSALGGMLPKIAAWRAQGWNVYGIFDEIHHASEDAIWGDSVNALGEMSERSILLSGTPFRSDGNRIPMVEYDHDGYSQGFTYSYRQAVADKVCRPVEFIPFECVVDYDIIRPDGEIIRDQLHWNPDAIGQDEQKAIRLGLDPAQPAVRDMLVLAKAKLDLLRQSDREAATILHCLGGMSDNGFQSDKTDDRHLSKVHALAKAAGFSSVMASSHDNNAHAIIKKFSTSFNQECLASIKQVSEGVDIQRARVSVYLTNIVTEMYFRQVVGRVVRWNPRLSDSQYGLMVYPATPTLTRFARTIEEEARVGLIDREKDDESTTGGGGDNREFSRNIVQSSVGSALGSIINGNLFSKDDRDLAAAAKIHDGGHYRDISQGTLADILRKGNLASSVNSPGLADGSSVFHPDRLRAKAASGPEVAVDEELEIQKLCGHGGLIQSLTRACIDRYPERFGEYNRIYSFLNDIQGVPRNLPKNKKRQEWLKESRGLAGIKERVELLKKILAGTI